MSLLVNRSAGRLKHILNFLSFIFTRLSAIGAYAFSVPFFIKYTSPTQYGIVAVGFSLLGFTVLFDVAIGYVVTLSLGRRLARLQPPNFGVLNGLFSLYVYLSLFCVVVALFIILSLSMSISERVYYSSLVMLLPCLSISGITAAIFQAHNSLVYINLSRFIFELCKALSLILSAVLVKSYVIIGPVLLLFALFRALLDWCILKRKLSYRLSLLKIIEVKKYFRIARVGIYSFASVIVTLILTIGDKVLIKNFISNEGVAQYSFSYDLNTKAYLLMNAINTTMYTIILKNHARRSSENTQIKIGLISVSILIFIYYVPLMIFSNKIISFLISASFASSTYKVTSIMSLASIFYLYGNVFENALSAKGCARYIFYVYFISIVGYFLALGLLYKVYGIYGFVYAYIIMCAVLCTGFIYMHHVLALSKTKILGGNVETI